ncbi:FecR family protein [Rubrivirga sp.]|uniref:FecR family protein n=1 Tax=Rubrivirga sp. TaxID=1885344 RepID=UPI003B517522
MPLAPPPDVRAWIDRQAAPDRAPLARAWAVAGLAADAPAPDADAAWARLDAALDGGIGTSVPTTSPLPLGEGQGEGGRIAAPARRASRPTTRPNRSPIHHSRWLSRWTASVALAAVVALAVVVGGRVEVRAEGTVAEVALPDGSTVALAPGSEVAFRRGLWGGTRRVALDGQGLFEVASDGRPFVVETGNAEVEVLGTVFDVLSWPSTDETAVTLVEGSVRLRSAGGAVTLDPGEVSRVAGAGAPTPPVATDVEAVTAWRRGGFSVVDAPLATVAAAVEGRFGRAVRLGAGVDPGRRLTLFLPDADSADAVLGDVAAYLDLRFSVGSDGYALLAR